MTCCNGFNEEAKIKQIDSEDPNADISMCF